ncbi:MAG: TolC family protein [Bryobacteraceae bacterium]
MTFRALLSLFCSLLLLLPPLGAQQVSGDNGWFAPIKRTYSQAELPRVDFANSDRLESLMRAGRIYLSLQDAIALALENNLDIELARYGPRVADSDVLRASAGQLLRGINTGIRGGPSGAGGGGVLQGADLLGTGGGGGGGGGEGGILSGITIQSVGTAIPNLDPVVFSGITLGHFTRPLTSRFVTATQSNFLVSENKIYNFGVQKGFLSGTTVTLGMNNNSLSQNSPNNDFNPLTNASLGVEIRQRLLQGFGRGLNSRQIRIAKNNRYISDLVFRQQVMATVTNVVNLYYELVSLNQILEVRRQALALNEKLYDDNRKQVRIGTLAPIEIVRAEAEVAASQQDVTNAETQVLQQETILKNVLSRTGVDSLAVIDARIIPTDRIDVPQAEIIEPVQDLIVKALEMRPDLEQSQMQIENSKISIKGTRAALLPSLDAVLDFTNNALAGQVNAVPVPLNPGVPNSPLVSRDRSSVDGFFLGGYGTVLSQLFARNFPDYSLSFQLNIPLRNRAAQADLARDQLGLRQQEIRDRQLRNQIRVDVLNAMVAMRQARAAYDTSVKARMLQEQTVAAERRKYSLGASSIINVIITQRDLAARQSAEVQALSTYARARTQLNQVTGDVLKAHDVSVEEAYAGMVKREPSRLPVLDPGVK